MGALVGLAVLLGYAWWLVRRLVTAPGYGPRARRPLLVAVVATLVVGSGLFLAAAMLLRRVPPEPVRAVLWPGLTVIALALYLTIGLVLVALVGLALRLSGGPERGSRRRARWLRVATPTVTALAVAVTLLGVWSAQRVGVTAYELTSPALPPTRDGLRIALVTDLHVGPLHGTAWTQRTVDLVGAQRPDLVVLGGDLVDGSPEDVGDYLAPLAGLDPPLGVVAVTGNHELFGGEAEALAWVAELESLGVDVLTNESVTLPGGAPGEPPVVVAGVHDETGTGALTPDPDAALAGVDASAYTVFVAHEPRQVEPGRGVDLQLSGHTHGGQLWPVQLVVPFSDPTVAGLDEVEGVTVVTSRGIGTSGPPVRVLAPAEVVVVTLRSSS